MLIDTWLSGANITRALCSDLFQAHIPGDELSPALLADPQ